MLSKRLGWGVSAGGRGWDPSPSAWSPWPTQGSHGHPTTHTDETGWHRGTIRGTVTFSEELLCLTKTSPRAARANGLIFCKMNLRHLLNYIPDLLSCASKDKVACELPKGGEMPAYFNRVHDPLLALWRPWSPPYMFTSRLIRQSHGQAWIILHRQHRGIFLSLILHLLKHHSSEFYTSWPWKGWVLVVRIKTAGSISL